MSERPIPLIDLRAQYVSLRQEIDHAVRRVLDSGVYVSGPEVKQFEQEMAMLVNVPYALSLANGTDALILALLSLGVGHGDEVITTPYTFFATAEAIARVGATPVFADIDHQTYNLDPEQVEACVTPRTKAIIPVHIFGQPAQMESFQDIAGRHGLSLIEDACQSLGASYKGEQTGGIAPVGCISYFPTKNLGAYGDGGMLLTRDETIYHHAKLLANHGSEHKYYHDIIGYNSRLDELQAAVLRVKLCKLHEWNARRQAIAVQYSEGLKPLGIRVPHTMANVKHVYHMYVIELADGEQREQLGAYLQSVGVATGRYYPCPLHLQRAFALLGYQAGDLPIAEQAAECTLALPMYPELTREQQQYVIDHVGRFFGI